MANYILKSHNGLDSAEKCYSFISHLESVMGKDLGTIITEYNTYPCFKKISNDGFYEMCSSLGKVTDTFLSYYDGIEHISRRRLFNPVALKNQLITMGKSPELAGKVVNFLTSIYIVDNEEARKEFYFIMYNLNKRCKENLFMAELLDIEKDVLDFVLCKNKEDEDGSKPKPNLVGISLLESIGKKTITLDIETQAKIIEIIEDQVNVCPDEEAIKAFISIADIIGVSVEL